VDVHMPEDEPRAGAETGWLAVAYRYPRGAELFLQGQRLQEVMQVVTGMVKLTQSDADGRESIVGLATSGEWIGTAAVIANRRAPVSAITCSSTTLKRLPADIFRQRLQHDRQLSRQIFEAHASELCRQTTRIGQLCSLPSLQRLQCALCRLASTPGRPAAGASVRLQLPLLHWELAEFIGVTPEHLSRLLKDMESRGLIRREKGGILLRNPECTCQGAEAESIGGGMLPGRA
jgi:CRP-like cAMP-binding protein